MCGQRSVTPPSNCASADGALRVAIDASSARLGGGTTYMRELLPRLASLYDIRLTSLLAPESLLSEGSFGCVERVVVARGRISACSPVWLAYVRRSADVLLTPTEIGFAPPGVPIVLALRSPAYDLAVRREFPRALQIRMWFMLVLARLSGRWADKHIAVSEFAAHIGRRALQVPSERIAVVYHGGSDPASQHAAPGRWEGARGVKTRFLFVSNVQAPFKNLHRLIDALSGVQGSWALDVAGRIDDTYGQVIERRAALYGIDSRIRFHGHCDRATLQRLYTEAHWLVWPSYGETFGHPLIEGHRAGLGLLVAEAASNPEIAGDAATYFPPFDVARMRDVLQAAVAGEIKRGAALPREYNWERCARETADVLWRCAMARPSR